MRNGVVSVIIVSYKATEELLSCISSIYHSKNDRDIEVIVVDNDTKSSLRKILAVQFPEVLYIKSQKNKGYGAGNNKGAQRAKGDYLFFINPDTILLSHTIDRLYLYLKKHPLVGVVAPLLLHADKKPYVLQGSTELTPFVACICLSFINKYFPRNFIAKKHFLYDWDKKSTRSVDVVPGTAFMISKKIFEKIGGFDENIFLFFEENDICKRVQNGGYGIVMLPQAKIVHLGGRSTNSLDNTKEIYIQSRHYYFTKYYGKITALLVECFLLSFDTIKIWLYRR